MGLELSEGSQAASVYFISPSNHETTSSEVTVVFGLKNFGVSPAGLDVTGTGHHHLIIDGKSIPAGQMVPMNATHKHFGKGQTNTELKLAPGKHTLTLQFADAIHMSYGPEMSTTIEIEVSK